MRSHRLPARLSHRLPAWLVDEAPHEPESGAALRRRRGVVAATTLAGTGLLGASLSAQPGSARFYGLTAATAAVWTAGGLASGPLHLGRTPAGPPHLPADRPHDAQPLSTPDGAPGIGPDRATDRTWGRTPQLPTGRSPEKPGNVGTAGKPLGRTPWRAGGRPVVAPVLTGAAAFGAFYGIALVARHIPVLERAISSVLGYADEGAGVPVLLTTLATGAAEEVFFRGAVFAAVGERHPVAVSTGIYALTTVATRNPALVLASAVVGALFGLQRRGTGGVLAPMLTHVTWSALMLRFMPPLFRRQRG